MADARIRSVNRSPLGAASRPFADSLSFFYECARRKSRKNSGSEQRKKKCAREKYFVEDFRGERFALSAQIEFFDSRFDERLEERKHAGRKIHHHALLSFRGAPFAREFLSALTGRTEGEIPWRKVRLGMTDSFPFLAACSAWVVDPGNANLPIGGFDRASRKTPIGRLAFPGITAWR